MAKFSTKERMIASLLSSFPTLKRAVKWLYVNLNAVVYKKNYHEMVHASCSSAIKQVAANTNKGETFFGYYDKPCCINDNILFHRTTSLPTKQVPSSSASIDIVVKTNKGEEVKVDSTVSYNWQQGARAQWLDGDKIIYNCVIGDHYGAKVYSLNERKVVNQFDAPVQDAYETDYFLSINYRRIMNLRADYGYRNFAPLSDTEMNNLEQDGIFKVVYGSKEVQKVHSLKEIVELNPKPVFAECHHVVNHVMISPNGRGFIFIHRYYQGKRRFDRLIHSDFKKMKVLADDKMVSHCCWVNDNTIIGYLRHNGKDGFYSCNVDNGNVAFCEEMSELGLGDGHPSCYGKLIVFDTYPDKSRMQHLFLYDSNDNTVTRLLEVYQSTAYMNECRCDLHPRFSDDGRKIFFDTVYSGKRQLCFIEIDKRRNE